MPNIVPKTYEQMQREFSEEITRLACLTHVRYIRNLHVPLYLAGTKRKGLDTLNPAADVWERLTVASEEEIDAREELHVIHPAPLSRAKTTEQNAECIRVMLRTEPLAIFAD